ncbi:MAG: aspartate carbamoyltransferase [Alphaproteobacteria bacterium]
MSLAGKHVISIKSINKDTLENLFNIAHILKPVGQGHMTSDVLNGAILGSLFFEPSTRTRLSFDSAFMKLGGTVSHTQGEELSSISKGESFYDTGRVIGGFYDCMVIRHKQPEAIDEVVSATNVPIINAGSGVKEHPTQSLLDVFTIVEELKHQERQIDGITVALIGDLKYGRTSHSLVYLLSLYKNINFVMLHPDNFELPEAVIEYGSKHGHSFTRAKTMQDALKNADVIYATRLQKERLPAGEKTTNFGADQHVCKANIDAYAKDNCIILHPLPRDSREGSYDLSPDLNTDPRLAIFKQTDNGVLTRMALFAMVLGVDHLLEKSMKPSRWFRPENVGTLV